MGITGLVRSMLGVKRMKRLKVAVVVPQVEAKKVEELPLHIYASDHGTSAQVDAIHDEDIEECESDLAVMPGSSMSLG